MWKIQQERKVARTLKKLPPPVLAAFERWQQVVMTQGPDTLTQVLGFKDEALSGVWAGYRSSRLNRQYRVVYWIEAAVCVVYVIAVTAHDYRRKR